MRHAETVTFGGSALNRAAEERGKADLLWQEPGARSLVIWRGKPLVTAAKDALLFVRRNNPIMSDASAEPILLGRDDDGPLFAADVSAWDPEEGEPQTMNAFLDTSLQNHPAIGDSGAFAELRSVMTALSPRAQSEMVQAGWQRTCPACGRHHFPRTDPVVIMLITHQDSVLLGRSPGWPEGMYSLLAGFIEPGETMEAAVRREVFEESGIKVGPVGYLASQPWPFPASLMFGCNGEALTTDITLDPVELEDACWVSRSDMALVFAGEHPTINPARKGAIAHFLLDNWFRGTMD